MEIGEVRIGNYFNSKSLIGKNLIISKVNEVKKINGKYCTFYEDNTRIGDEVSELIGIKLTKEWLLKFGFSKINGMYQLNEFPLSFGIIKQSGMYKLRFGAYCQVTIEFVNQLQNLYFALTGIELVCDCK